MGWLDSGGFWHEDFVVIPTVTTNIPAPVRIPFKCPVCEGRGMVPNGFYYPTPDTANQTCLACGGKGIVWDKQ